MPCRQAAWLAGLALAAALAPAAAAVAPPRLGEPALDPAGAVRWAAPRETRPEWTRDLALPPTDRADSLALWTAAAAQPHLAAVARHRLALLHLAAGDTARADSCWAGQAGPSPWAWSGLRERAALALARAGAAAADSVLERADRSGWSAGERAAWLAERVRLRALAGDTARALDLARQALRVYPAQAATRQALARLEQMQRARGERLAVADERAAAEVEALGGRVGPAAERLRRVVEGSAGAGARGEALVRRCELLRSARRFGTAAAVARNAATDPELAAHRGRLTLERARAERGAGRVGTALALYERVAADSSLAAQAAWEAGRAAEDEGWAAAALEWYGRAARGGGQAEEARLRAGLLLFAAGRVDSAAACWALGAGEAARFWRGVALRALGEAAEGDSLLREVAAAAGYSFYRGAARDTLGLAGRTGRVVVARAGEGGPEARAADELAAVGAGEEADRLLAWLAEGRAGWAGGGGAGDALAGARSAYARGRTFLGVTIARGALELAAAQGDSAVWAVVPWTLPPAYEALLAVPRDTVAAALEPALLYGVVMQESRFEPRARSRSDALGLMQLKLGTAGDMARQERDPAPTEAALFDPERNVRYGTRYLAWLLRRFDGSVAAALCAYNAGPGRLAAGWRGLLERGGEALVCELASNPAAQDYARRVLGFRSAYRELRPATGP